MARPYIGDEERVGVMAVLDSGVLSKGPNVAALEEEWAAYCGARYAVAMSSGTAALTAALHACGVGPGVDVFTVAFTFNATVAAILAVGARPVFVDIDPQTFLMDTDRLQEAIFARDDEPYAVVPVDLFGLAVDSEAINWIGGPIVEDASQAHGAVTASAADAVASSLYATKNMTAGEGGLVATDSAAIRDHLMAYRSHGTNGRAYVHESLGFNFRLGEMGAAVALAQLRRLDEMNELRRGIADYYRQALADLSVVLPYVPQRRKHVYHQFVVKVDAERRDAIRASMLAKGVQTAVHYPVPVHQQPYFVKLYGEQPRLPVTEKVAGEVISLPIFPNMTASEQDQVIEAFRAAVFA